MGGALITIAEGAAGADGAVGAATGRRWSGHDDAYAGDGCADGWGSSPLFADASSIDVPSPIDGQGGDLLLGRAVQNEAIALRRDAIDEAAAVGAGEEVAKLVEVEGANLGFVALEKQAAGTVAVNAEDLAAIAGADVELALAIQCQRPDVFRLGIEKDTGGVAGIDVTDGCGFSPGFAPSCAAATSAVVCDPSGALPGEGPPCTSL